METLSIPCAHCGKLFTPVALQQCYCSASCRSANWQQRNRGDTHFSGTDYALLKRLGLPWIQTILDNPKEHWDAEDRMRSRPDKPLTWHKLIKLEPRLLSLFQLAKAAYDDRSTDSYCANMIWYRSFKPIVCALVGWSADNPPHPSLITSAAYDIAYETIYDALPGCRNCGCL